MMAADVVDAAVDFVPGETPEAGCVGEPSAEGIDAWEGCDRQAYDRVDPTFFTVDSLVVDSLDMDDSCMVVDGSREVIFEPIDIRVQFVSSETTPGWAVYSYTVNADGVVQGVSVIASYDEPTIAAFVAQHADDPAAEISDYGDGWWVGRFPPELAPPVPDAVPDYALCGGGVASADDFSDVGTGDESDTSYDWYDDGSGTVFTCGWSWGQNSDAGGDRMSTWDDSGAVFLGDWSGDWSWDEWSGGDSTGMPLFYARGSGMIDSFRCGLSDPSAAGADGTGQMREGDLAVVEPVAASPRAAAFADMGTMAAAATAMPAGSAAVLPSGGRRRR